MQDQLNNVGFSYENKELQTIHIISQSPKRIIDIAVVLLCILWRLLETTHHGHTLWSSVHGGHAHWLLGHSHHWCLLGTTKTDNSSKASPSVIIKGYFVKYSLGSWQLLCLLNPAWYREARVQVIHSFILDQSISHLSNTKDEKPIVHSQKHNNYTSTKLTTL